MKPGNKQVVALIRVALLVGVIAVTAMVSVADAPSGGSYYHDSTSGAYTDQQCQPVCRRTIEVTANPDAIYPPAVLKNYPSTPVRGVRMQASSCSNPSVCSQRLDCLQAAGATVLYYAIYYQVAYYHSDLLLHRSFDSLAYLVPEAHARGMKVYTLIPAARIGWKEHPDLNARLNHPELEHDWLDFAVPEARSFVADVAEELVTGYDVDGIFLDYIRWDSGSGWPSSLSADDVSLTVQGVYERVKAIRNVDVAASVFKGRENAGWVKQRWYDWLDGGYVNYVTPMAYVGDDELQSLLVEYDESGHFPGRIIPRLAVVTFSPIEAKAVEDILRQIQMCYDADADGVTLWDDRYICNNPDLVEALGAGGW